VDDVTLPQRFDKHLVRGPGQVGQALLGANEGSGGHMQVGIGGEEFADLPIADAEAMFHLGGHGQDQGAEGVTGSAEGIGGLFGMASLPVLPAARTVAGLDVELGDNGDDGRQVRLVLHDDVGVAQGHVAGGAFGNGDVEDTSDLLGRRDGAEGGLVPRGAARLFECAGLRLFAAERVGLAVLFAAGLVQALAEIAVLVFHLSQAALPAPVIPPQALDFLGQQYDAAAQVQNLAIPFVTARTGGTTRQHGDLSKRSCGEAGWSARCVSSRCTTIIGPRSRNGTNSNLPRP
jgi:hypothetical protein